MKKAVVFFDFKRNKKINKYLKKQKIKKNTSKIYFLSIIKKNILSALAICIIIVVVCSNNIKKIYDIKQSSLININETKNLDESFDESLKKYNIDLNNINYYNTNNYQKIQLSDIQILNYSHTKNLDFAKILEHKIKFDRNKDKILLYNTHASESYSNSEKYKFNYSGTYRSKEESFNMLGIGDKFCSYLKKYQIKFNHDKTPHDYQSYLDAYKRSAETIKKNISKEKYSLCIDLHRDALGDLTKGMVVEINGMKCAKLMFVIGMGTSGLYNQYALENLSCALNIMALANDNYKGLFRPMIIRDSKYNQDLNRYSLLIECGTTGNTIEEAQNSMKILAKLINEFYKK